MYMKRPMFQKNIQGYIQNENQNLKLFYKQVQMLLDGLKFKTICAV